MIVVALIGVLAAIAIPELHLATRRARGAPRPTSTSRIVRARSPTSPEKDSFHDSVAPGRTYTRRSTAAYLAYQPSRAGTPPRSQPSNELGWQARRARSIYSYETNTTRTTACGCDALLHGDRLRRRRQGDGLVSAVMYVQPHRRGRRHQASARRSCSGLRNADAQSTGGPSTTRSRSTVRPTSSESRASRTLLHRRFGGSVNGSGFRWHRWIAAAIAIAVTAGVHSAWTRRREIDPSRLFVPEPDARAAFEPRLRHRGRGLLLAPGPPARRRRDEATPRSTAQPLIIGRLIDVVTALDPWVGHPYRFAAVWLTDSEQSVRREPHCSSAASPTTRSTGATATTSASTTSSTSRRTSARRTPSSRRCRWRAPPTTWAPGREAAHELRRARDGGGLPRRARANGAGRVRPGRVPEGAGRGRDRAPRARYPRRRPRGVLAAARAGHRARRGPPAAGRIRHSPQLPAAHPQFDFYEWVLDETAARSSRPTTERATELHVTPRDAARASAGAGSGARGERES